MYSLDIFQHSNEWRELLFAKNVIKKGTLFFCGNGDLVTVNAGKETIAGMRLMRDFIAHEGNNPIAQLALKLSMDDVWNLRATSTRKLSHSYVSLSDFL